MVKRGLVVEKDGQTVIVLTPDGRFQKVRRGWANAELGSEITFDDSWSVRRIPYGRLIPVLMLAFLVLTMTGLMDLWGHQTYMYVMVGPEPKVEFGVNRLNRVVEVIPQTTEASWYKSASNFYGRPVEHVLRQLMTTHRQDAITSPVYYVVTVPAAGTKEETVETAAIKSGTATHPLQQHFPSALVLSVPPVVREEAARRGMYPGDYAVYWLYTQSGGAMEQLAQFVQ